MKHLGTLLLGLAGLAVVFAGHAPGVKAPAAGPAPESVAAALPPSRPAAAPAGNRFVAEGISIPRDESGQFHIEVAVNGAPLRLLIDTGADVVALTEGDAQRAGIAVDPGAYRPILRTASGEGLGMPVRIERLELGQTELRDVSAVIVKDLDTSLLGQSVLGRLGRVELRGDTMVLEPSR